MSKPTCTPVYPIPFKILDETKIHLVPIRIDNGMYYLRAPYRFSIDIKPIRTLALGITLKLPTGFNVATSKSEITTPLIIHAHIESLYDAIVDRGLEIIAPKVLSSAYNDTELKLTVRNIGTKIATFEPGDPIACLYFTTVPPIIFGENNNI